MDQAQLTWVHSAPVRSTSCWRQAASAAAQYGLPVAERCSDLWLVSWARNELLAAALVPICASLALSCWWIGAANELELPLRDRVAVTVLALFQLHPGFLAAHWRTAGSAPLLCFVLQSPASALLGAVKVAAIVSGV